jgi:hypothetical protein
MNQDQSNITGMQTTVAAYMQNNFEIWKLVKAIVDTVAELKANNVVIAEKATRQENILTGASAQKAQAKHDLEEKILEIADQLSSLAAKNKDAVLGPQVELHLSALDKLEDDQLEAKGKNISALAVANLAALADYNVLQADVTALNDLVTKWAGVKNVTHTAISDRAGETKTLPQAIADNTSLLRNQLDKQLTKFKKTNPKFYAGYLAARVVINQRSHHKAAQPAPPGPA